MEFKDFVIENGVLKEYLGTDADVVIPNGVTAIEAGAFRECDKLVSLTIPDSVTTIKNRAFEGCTELVNITVPKSVTTIGGSAFLGCRKLADKKGFVVINGVLLGYYGRDTDVVIPDGVEVIGCCEYSAFVHVTIPASVKHIDYFAFYACTELEIITIPEGVTTIDASAFEECTSLKSITIPGSVTKIGDFAFEKCTDLASLIIVNGVKEIGCETFYGCTSLKEVMIPDSVTTIGGYAFDECENLLNVTIPATVQKIGKDAFPKDQAIMVKGFRKNTKLVSELLKYRITNIFSAKELAWMLLYQSKKWKRYAMEQTQPETAGSILEAVAEEIRSDAKVTEAQGKAVHAFAAMHVQHVPKETVRVVYELLKEKKAARAFDNEPLLRL